MRKALIILCLATFFIGCNMNPSKEARIQKLESEIQQSIDQINQLEKRVANLESSNAQLKSRLLEIEK